jgi:hypothetical protein
VLHVVRIKASTDSNRRYNTANPDIPAHVYQLSFESNPEWSQFYASGPEILKYWKRVVEKYNLRKYMKLGHRAVEARWNEEQKKWHVKLEIVETGEIVEDVGDVLMAGIGALNEWKWPDIPGLHDFKGEKMHSATWDDKFDYKVCGQELHFPFSPGCSLRELGQTNCSHWSRLKRNPNCSNNPTTRLSSRPLRPRSNLDRNDHRRRGSRQTLSYWLQLLLHRRRN